MRTSNRTFVFSIRAWKIYVSKKHLYAKYQAKLDTGELNVRDLTLKHVHHKIKNQKFQTLIKQGVAIVYRGELLSGKKIEHLLLYNKRAKENLHVSYLIYKDWRLISRQPKRNVEIDFTKHMLLGIPIN